MNSYCVISEDVYDCSAIIIVYAKHNLLVL